jgi:hypothetical protein
MPRCMKEPRLMTMTPGTAIIYNNPLITSKKTSAAIRAAMTCSLVIPGAFNNVSSEDGMPTTCQSVLESERLCHIIIYQEIDRMWLLSRSGQQINDYALLVMRNY